jgi:hypothetical protein
VWCHCYIGQCEPAIASDSQNALDLTASGNAVHEANREAWVGKGEVLSCCVQIADTTALFLGMVNDRTFDRIMHHARLKAQNPQSLGREFFMPQAKSEAIRLMNEQYEIIWTIANSPDSDLDEPERTDLNEKLEQLLASIKRLKPRPN